MKQRWILDWHWQAFSQQSMVEARETAWKYAEGTRWKKAE
jgi:hypothetical protein